MQPILPGDTYLQRLTGADAGPDPGTGFFQPEAALGDTDNQGEGVICVEVVPVAVQPQE